jgi:hypothetical protein
LRAKRSQADHERSAEDQSFTYNLFGKLLTRCQGQLDRQQRAYTCTASNKVKTVTRGTTTVSFEHDPGLRRGRPGGPALRPVRA